MADRVVRAILRAEVTQFVGAMRAAEKSTKDFSKNATDSAVKHKASWDQVGKGMMVTGGVMAAGVGLAVKSFMDFDASMSKAQAGTMATGASLAALRAAAIDAGAKTQFSATEAADAITAMGKAGVSTKDILGGGLTGALDLAAAGQLDVAQASEIAATAMNQFGLEGKDIPHVADLLAAGAGKAMGSVQDLAEALKYVGPVSKGMGVSIEETTGTLAMFAQQGIIGEQAGTSLRGVMLSLTAPSAIAAKKMEELGINVYDANGKFVGLNGVAGQLHTQLGGLTNATRDQALGQIFGNNQVTAARILYEGGAGAVDKWTKSVNDSGFAARQAAMLTDNLKGDLERLGGSLSSVLIQSGSGANGMLRSMTKSLQGLVDTYGELPVPVQQGVVALGAVTGAALLAGGAFISLYPKIKATQVALGDMGRTGVIATRSLKGLAGAASTAFIALPLVSAAGDAVRTSLGGMAVETAAAADSLTEFTRNGKAAGQGAALINSGFGDLEKTLYNVFSTNLTHKADAFLSKIGTFGGIFGGTQTDDAVEFFKTLDAGLAQMVSSGNATQAAALLKRVTDSAGKQGYSIKTVTAALPGYTAATKAAGDAEAIAAGKMTTASGAKLTGKAASDALKVSEDSLAQAAEDNKKAHDALIDSVTNYGNALLTARGDARSYEAAIDAATEAVKKNGRTLDIGTEKGRDNQAALDGIATAALKAAQSTLENAEANGTLNSATKTVTGNVGKARTQFISTAVSMGMNRKAAGLLATQQGLTAERVRKTTTDLIALGKQRPTPKADVDKRAADAKIKTLQAQINAIKQGRQPGIDANTAAGKQKIANLQAQINNLKGKSIDVNVLFNKKPTGAFGTLGYGVVKKAAGGQINGVGTKTSDSNLIAASRGEHMLTADDVEAAGGHGAIYAWRKSLHGYAKGGAIEITMPSGSALTRASAGASDAVLNKLDVTKLFGAGGASILGGGGGAGGAARWTSTVLAVLAMLGQSPANLAAVLRLINKESGGNPRAINLWDSNAKAGHPSMGLIQTIIGTFNAHAGPFRSRGPMDPLANIYAGLHYAIARYGSIAAVDPLRHKGGYANGTNSAAPGWGLVGENGPEWMKFKGGEKVIPNHKLDSLNASRFSAGTTVATTVHLTVNPSAGMNERQLAKAVVDQMNNVISGGLTRVGVA